MRDRVSTKILDNGATRYGVYDEDGKLLRYEYIKLEDEPSTEGDFFNKANMLPDSIPKLLGLKMENPQVKDALNVLANVGNLHVWERVQTYSEPVPEVPAGYTLGAIEENVSITNTTSSTDYIVMYSATSLTVSNDGTISTSGFGSTGGKVTSVIDKMYGKFIYFRAEDSDFGSDNIIFIPSDATRSWGDNGEVVVSKLQRVTGYPYTPAIPAGTTTDYLTSTDRNAYPDQSSEGGQDAYYTLGDVVTGKYKLGRTTSGYPYVVTNSDSVEVLSDGVVSMPASAVNNTIDYSKSSVTTTYLNGIFLGKFVQLKSKNASATVGSGYLFTTCPSEVMFIPSDATITLESGTFYIDKYQPVTGHAAIPANTTITYLGQLGGGARIEVGSYVGTGTQGSANPTSLTFNFVPKMVIVTKQGQYGFALDGTFSSYSLFWIPGITYFNPGGSGSASYADAQKNKITLSGKTLSWYRDSTSSDGDASHQLNASGKTYQWVALG